MAMGKDNKEEIQALFELGQYAAAVYAGAIEKSGSVEIAKDITFQFIKASIRPDTPPKFFM